MNLAAAVIAGGKSTRMGRDKALLPVRGHDCLLSRQIALLKTICPNEILLSCRRRQFPVFIPGVRQIFDDGNSGPLGGLAAILRVSRVEMVFVLAVDLPRISATMIRRIAAQASCSGGKGVVPRTREGIEPLAAVFPTAILQLLDQRLQQSDDKSMHALVNDATKSGFLSWYEAREHELPEFSNWNCPPPV